MKFFCKCRTHCQRNPTSHNTVAAQEALASFEHMHTAAVPAGTAGCPAKQFRHRAVDIMGFSQIMAMTAMCAENIIVIPQNTAYSDRNRLFPDIEMKRALEHPGSVNGFCPFFEPAQNQHPLIKFNSIEAFVFHCYSLFRILHPRDCD